ncbi:hypothetical protein HK101_006899, partial [Irineochytrium annulatum]
TLGGATRGRGVAKAVPTRVAENGGGDVMGARVYSREELVEPVLEDKIEVPDMTITITNDRFKMTVDRTKPVAK